MSNNNSEEVKKVYCDKCGKLVSTSDGRVLAGLIAGVGYQPDASDEERQFAQKNAGVYEVNRVYSFCVECLLNTLMRTPSSRW